MTATAHINRESTDRPVVAYDSTDEELFGPHRSPRRRGRRVTAVVTIIAIVAAVGAFVFSSTSASGARYRVATVTNADATAVLDGVATIEPVSQATVAFPTSGTVTRVVVKAGQTVRAGQTLAALDTKSLYQTIHTKQASLASAKLTLANALNGT